MVEPLDFLDDGQLLRFLHLNKTELSCMENLQTFVCQLRDYSLISNEQYSKISRMKSREKIRSTVYNVLDSIENERPKFIQRFWRCVFKETILNKYPTLRLLRNSLFDGSYACESALLEAVDSQESVETETNEKQEEELEMKKVKKGPENRKKRKNTIADDDDEDEEEQPMTSAQVTPRLRKKPKKLCFSTPLKRGEKGDIWTWKIFKVQLPVTCGELKGTLNRDRLAKGEKCILVDKQWYSPSEFERLAGKGAYKNWKSSIHCKEATLGKLLQEGHLKCTGYKRVSKAKKHLFPSEKTTAVSAEIEDNSSDLLRRESSSDSTEHEEDDDGVAQLQLETRKNPNRVLKVVCENITGLLHTKRFASGTCGRSIRTETSWMTPVDFLKEASCQTDISWKKHITCEGKPLGELLKANVLEIHSLLCTCSLCVPDRDDLDNEKNDDECWICHREGTLVACDQCPCSFHQKCHLPHIPDTMLDDGKTWVCTRCVLIKNLNMYPELEMEAAMSRLISAHLLHCQYLLLGLYRADEDCIFKSDPCQLPKYTSMIPTPMWFDQVADKLQSNRYQTVREFVSDIQLIFSNCASYNQNNPEFLSLGTKIEDFFKGELKKVFKIQQASESEAESEFILFIPQGETIFVSDMQSTSK